MSALFDGTINQLGSEGIGQISKSLGADESAIRAVSLTNALDMSIFAKVLG